MEHAEKTILSGDYIAGFVDGEGCFSLVYRKDFNLWSEAVEILYNHKRNGTQIIKGVRGFKEKMWNKNDLDRLNIIRKLMKKYKSMRSGFKYSPI